MDVAHEFVITGGGESLQTLVVGTGMYNETRDEENQVNELVIHCPNVTSLSTSNFCFPWLCKIGRQLVKLEVIAESPLDLFLILKSCASSRSVQTMDAKDIQIYGAESDTTWKHWCCLGCAQRTKSRKSGNTVEI